MRRSISRHSFHMILVVLSGTFLVIASNMAFKLNKLLTGGFDHWVSLPYSSPYLRADDVLKHLMSDSGVVTRFIPGTPPTVDFWTGTSGTNFQIVPGEGLVLTPLSTQNSIIVGSHDPGVSIPAGGFTANVDYLVSLPYNTSASTAGDLLQELPPGASITRSLLTSPPSVEFWTGTSGTNFSLRNGEGYMVRTITNAPSFAPAHY